MNLHASRLSRSLFAQATPSSGLIWTVLPSGLVTLLAWPLHAHLDPANTAMLYLLAVAFVAMKAGKRAAIAAAILSTGLLDFFFIHPQLSFTVNDAQHAITLAVMLGVALIISNLTQVLQRQVLAAVERERQSQALYQLASQLAGATALEQVITAVRQFLFQAQGVRSLLLMRQDDDLRPAETATDSTAEYPHASALAAMQQAQTQQAQLADHHWLLLPLPGSTYVRGVLAIDFGPTSPAALPSQQSLYEAIASLLAISVERLHFVEVAQRTQLQMADERLRSAILSALSHDIRTPLTVLYGMADTLSLMALPPAAGNTASAIREQALRLNSMVSNLLDMARLRSGSVQLELEWQPLEEVVGASIKLLGDALARHTIRVELPPDLPLLRFDAVLIERVLCNLLENAAKYASPSSLITLRAEVGAGVARIAVCDNGPGFPPDKLNKVFGLFERGHVESNVAGVGLGLAICHSIVAAHGGEISARNADGACVSFTLPLGEPPPIGMEEHDE
jgi:two-component system sensor histidine kinase KdpD